MRLRSQIVARSQRDAFEPFRRRSREQVSRFHRRKNITKVVLFREIRRVLVFVVIAVFAEWWTSESILLGGTRSDDDV